MERSKIRVLIVDDYQPWSDFVDSMLGKVPGLEVIAQVLDGLEAVQKAEELQPDLILLDISLPGLNGIEAARQIRKCAPRSRILFVSENRTREVVDAALDTGALGYIVKSEAGRELLLALDEVLHGKRHVSAGLSRPVLVKTGGESSMLAPRIEANPYLRYRQSTFIPEFLASVIDATAADFGNVQLFDSDNRVLRIVAHYGFDYEFLRFFDTVSCDHGCGCSTAMNERSRVVVGDVAIDPLFSNDSRDVLLRAGIRSVQSTPLIDSFGDFVGMVSTHHRCPGGHKPQVWERVDHVTKNFLAKVDHR